MNDDPVERPFRDEPVLVSTDGPGAWRCQPDGHAGRNGGGRARQCDGAGRLDHLSVIALGVLITTVSSFLQQQLCLPVLNTLVIFPLSLSGRCAPVARGVR